MDYNNKKIIIYGKNRYQRDFQYIFNHLEVSYYIDDIVQQQVLPISALRTENFKEIFIIICKPRQEQSGAIEKLQEEQLKQNINFCLADDLFCELDYDINKMVAGKKVVVWGTGAVAKEFCDNYKKNYDDITIDFFIDSDINKKGKLFFGKEVLHIDDIDDWNSYYIIIAIADYKAIEINKVIEDKGFQNNYIQASRLLSEKPSERLKKTIYDTNQYQIGKCSKINDLRVLENGNICPCGSVNGYIMGNVFLDKPIDIWNSIYERIYRLSLLNRTHTFCDGNKCPYLVNRKQIERKLEETSIYDEFSEQPYLLLLELDRSCNIMCTSCRDSILIEENDRLESLCKHIINSYLNCSDRLVLTGNGEIFASKYGKRILQSAECIKRKHISILTNGLAFNNHNWNLYLSSYQLVDVSVSIDAASEETYLKIRRKSNWKILNKNLEFIHKLKSEGKVGFFQINFVVQKDNVHEMGDFVRLGKMLKTDRVLFNLLENWKYTDEEFEKKSIMNENFLIKGEYKKFFSDVILNDNDIDYTNIAQAIGKNAKDAYMY